MISGIMKVFSFSFILSQGTKYIINGPKQRNVHILQQKVPKLNYIHLKPFLVA